MISDFGMLGRAIDYLKGRAAKNEETKLRERFVEIIKAQQGNVYAPEFGSALYWEAKEMEKRGWLSEVHPFGFMRPRTLNPGSYSGGLYGGRNDLY